MMASIPSCGSPWPFKARIWVSKVGADMFQVGRCMDGFVNAE